MSISTRRLAESQTPVTICARGLELWVTVGQRGWLLRCRHRLALDHPRTDTVAIFSGRRGELAGCGGAAPDRVLCLVEHLADEIAMRRWAGIVNVETDFQVEFGHRRTPKSAHLA